MRNTTLKDVLDTYYLLRLDKTGPKYFDTPLSDTLKQEIYQKGYMTGYPHVWGCFEDFGKWIYFETDRNEKVTRLEELVSERDLYEFVDARLCNLVNRNRDEGFRKEKVFEIFLNYKYEKYRNNRENKNIDNFLDKLKQYPELYEEMYKYIDEWGFSTTNPNRVKVEGYTAEKLMDDYDFILPEAYEYMIRLYEDPIETKRILDALKKI